MANGGPQSQTIAVVVGAIARITAAIEVAETSYDAVELEEQAETIELNAGAVIWATGWRPYDAAKIDVHNYADSPNIITNVEMERLANHDGLTGGAIEPCLERYPRPKKVRVEPQLDFAHNRPDKKRYSGGISV